MCLKLGQSSEGDVKWDTKKTSSSTFPMRHNPPLLGFDRLTFHILPKPMASETSKRKISLLHISSKANKQQNKMK